MDPWAALAAARAQRRGQGHSQTFGRRDVREQHGRGAYLSGPARKPVLVDGGLSSPRSSFFTRLPAHTKKGKHKGPPSGQSHLVPLGLPTPTAQSAGPRGACIAADALPQRHTTRERGQRRGGVSGAQQSLGTQR